MALSLNLNAKLGDRKKKGKGTYDEQLNRQFPYTFFVADNNTEGFINEVKINLRTKSELRFLLRFVFERYNGSYASFNKNQTYQKSMKAKAAAFIYMIGLKYNDATLNIDTLPAFGSPDREVYANVAHDILTEIDDKKSYFNGINRQRLRAFELLNYLETYDYLMTAKTVLQNSSLQDESQIKENLLDFTHELHAASNNLFQAYSRTNNISLIVASAIGTSAVIFSQEGAGRLQIQRHPERWAHAAHGYIARTLFIGNSWSNLKNEGPMLNSGAVTNYAEGSHYFTYAWQCMLVFMKTYYQAKGIKSLTDGSDPGGREYNPCKVCSKVKTESYNSPNYQNLYKGYIESLDLNGRHPTVDDTWMPDRRFAPLLTLGDNRYNPYLKNFDKIPSFIGKKEDFNGPGDGAQTFEANVLLTKFSGNFAGLPKVVGHGNAGYAAIRTPNLYLYLSAERDNMVEAGFHEHGDVGSFEIRAGEGTNVKQMVFDPPYFGEDDKGYVQEGYQHNCIIVDGDGPHKKDQAVSTTAQENLTRKNADGTTSSYSCISTTYNYWNRFSQWNMRTAITRKMSVFNDIYPYIVIEDEITNNSASKNDISFRMNGNGYYDNGSFYLRDNNEAAIWCKTCLEGDSGYRMRLTTSLLNGDGSLKENLTFIKSWQNIGSDGPISFVTSEPRELKSDKQMKLISKIEFIPCRDTIGLMTRNVITNQSIFFRAVPRLGSINYHAFTYVDSINTDTIHDINKGDSSEKIVYEAKAFHIGYNLDPNFSFGSCNGNSNIRFYEIVNGSSLVFKDTVLVACNEKISAFIKMIGYNRYAVKVNSNTIAQLKLYLFGLGENMAMKVDGLTYLQDSSEITISLPNKPIEFIIEPLDPCLASCYFPPTAEEIDSIFNFNDGSYQNLGHKLDIESPNGILAISNGSKMEISCNKYLRNKDSLILVGDCGNDFELKPCEEPSIKFKTSPLSGLLISSGAALVLDSGSYTAVGNNTSLLVKSGGSLVIKDSAILEIGGGDCGGYGMVMAEPGAYVYIQPGAKIKFHKVIGDTSDKQKFFISLVPAYQASISGVSNMILPLLADDTILTNPLIPNAVAFCNLKNTMNPVIQNKEWGFANFMAPNMDIKLRNDTLCPNEPMIIDLRRILNDNNFWFEVCRMDSIYTPAGNGKIGFWTDTCLVDTMTIDSILTDPTCIPPHASPDRFVYQFKDKSVHRVTLKVTNDCGAESDTLFFVTMTDEPNAEVFINDNTCPGYGTSYMVIQTNFIGNYTVEINQLDTGLSSLDINQKPPLYLLDSTGTVPDTLFFNDVYFKGGKKYLVSLQLLNDCGNYLYEDTISIPFGVDIQLERSTLYANPVHGARTVQLHGYVNSADSFKWSPANWLNRTDTLVVQSTPEDSISYVLTAYQGSCVAYDTAFVKYNRVANAGIEDTVCYTSTKVLLGNGYDLSVFLGFMYYKGGADFRDNWFSSRTIANTEYFKYLSMFMQTTSFKSWAQSTGFLNDFTEDLYREQTIKEPWFINYFEQLTAFSDPDLRALDTFVYYIDQNQKLKNNYNQTGNYSNYAGQLTTFFAFYDDFVSNQLNTISISWISITGKDTSFNGSLQESAIAIAEPSRTTTYIQQVITPEYAEIDETIVYVDTIPEVAFAVQWQIDSSVVFQNYTFPQEGAMQYSWNFGDGSSASHDIHPLHTFAAFDTLFRVCLTATNDCGSYTWCDTIYIDSAHWGGNMRSITTPKDIVAASSVKESGIEAVLYPNPTSGNCNLSYRISTEANLRITDAQGRLVYESRLAEGEGLKSIPSEGFSNGLYIFSVQTEAGSVKGRIMVQR